MSSPMRWGDSDSSDEEAYVPSMKQPQEEVSPDDVVGDDNGEPAEDYQPYHQQQQPLIHRKNNNNRDKKVKASKGGSKSNRQHQQQRDRGSGTGRVGNQHRNDNRPREGDWKKMAKSASRFNHSVEIAAAPVDGSAWMAQRRAKREQDEQEQRAKEEQDRAQEQEEKRQRRKSQLDALKAAMHEIKETEPPVTSPPSSTSSKRKIFRGEGLSGSNLALSPPLQILTRKDKGLDTQRNHDKGKHDGSSGKQPQSSSRQEAFDTRDKHGRKGTNNVNSMAFTIGPLPASTPAEPPPAREQTSKDHPQSDSQQPTQIVTRPQEYSFTIGPPSKVEPRGELQPNGTVKFSRKSSLTGNKVSDKSASSTDKPVDGETEPSTGEEHSPALTGVADDMKASSPKDETEDQGMVAASEKTSHGQQHQSALQPSSGAGQGGSEEHCVDDEEASMTSKGSRRTSFNSTSRGRGGRGRGGRNKNYKGGRGRGRGNHSADNDDSSVTSNRSTRSNRSQKGGRGGGRGGRRRNSSSKKGGRGDEDRSRGGGGGRGRSHARGGGNSGTPVPSGGRGRDSKGRGRGDGHGGGKSGRASGDTSGRGRGPSKGDETARRNEHSKGAGRGQSQSTDGAGRGKAAGRGRDRGGRRGGRSRNNDSNRGGRGGRSPAAPAHSYEIGK